MNQESGRGTFHRLLSGNNNLPLDTATRPYRTRRRYAPVSAIAALSILFGTALAVAGCHSTPPPTPLEQLNAEQRAGYEAFQAHCALCHNERTSDAKNGPPLLGVFKKPYLPSGAPANDERVTATILGGHGLMPAQPYLDPDTVRALLAYLHTV